jgi:hypothetical protein
MENIKRTKLFKMTIYVAKKNLHYKNEFFATYLRYSYGIGKNLWKNVLLFSLFHQSYKEANY